MGKVERQCPPCYRRLPQPQDVLGPCDHELNYVLWSPGFKWKPESADEEEEYGRGETATLGTIKEKDDAQLDEDMKEAEQEALEATEDRKQYDQLNGGNPITITQAAFLARQLGMAPSYSDMEKFKDKHGEQLDWAAFAKFRSQLLHPEDTTDDFTAAFAHFDAGHNGYLTKKQMRNILATYGEPLNDQEADAMLVKFCKDDQVDYRAFCEAILARD